MATPSNRKLNYPPSKTAIITGASSGIGKAFADYFASVGYNLIITGRRSEKINQVASELRARFGVHITVVIADLSVSEHVTRLMREVDHHGFIEVLVNNAGFGMDCRFSEDYFFRQMKMLDVHVNVPLQLIHKVLPQMMKSRKGIIVNVSSLSAYLPTAANGMYTSTKSFLRNFTESLHMDVGEYGIRVQCLCPGFTHSEFHRNTDIDTSSAGLVPWMMPSEVVKYSMNSLNKGQVICIPGFINKLIVVTSGMLPRNLYYLIARWLELRIRNQNQKQENYGRISGELSYQVSHNKDSIIRRTKHDAHSPITTVR